MLANMFKNPEILNKETHQDLKLSQYKNYEFSKDVSLVPIGLEEMLVASKSLIVVFIKDQNNDIFPAVVLGGEGDENLLLSKDFTWKPSTYIPAAIRCYPFGLGNTEDNMFVTVDTKADVVQGDSGNLIIKDKESFTKEGDHAINFVTEVYSSINNTKELTKTLESLDVLKQAELTITKNEQEFFVKNGVYIIDENSLNKLESRKLKKLATGGFFKFIYAHLLSLNNQY